MKTLLRMLLRLFPQDTPGIDRAEMEETFFDAVRGRPLSVPRELFFLLLNGLAERLESMRRSLRFSGFVDDFRSALRALRRRKAFVLGAVLMLALGIGVNTAVFSMGAGMSRVVQRFQDHDELVFLWGVEPGWDRAAVSAPDFFAWQDETSAFQEMGAYSQRYQYLSGDGDPARVLEARTSANLLPMLGLRTQIGRLYDASDEATDASPVAVLTWRLWQERYAGEDAVLGRTILLNEVAYTIIGVLPRTVDFESLWRDTRVFTPLVLNPAEQSWERRSYRVMARLAQGSTVQQADAQLSAVATRLSEAQPETNAEVRARVEPFEEFFYSADDQLAMVGMGLAVLAVLLIACVNLANLLMAKGAARQGEMAIRLALGASRGRMVRQLLCECLILAFAGGALGIVLGQWGMSLLLSGLPTSPFLLEEVGLDSTLLLFTFGISGAAALTFGLTPALLASRVSLREGVIESGVGASAGRKRKRMRTWILVTQLSLSVPLVLTCAVSFLNLQALQSTDFGFPTDGLLTAQVSLPPHLYPEADQYPLYFEEAVQAVGAVPGITAVAAGMNIPIGASQASARLPLVAQGREAEEGSARGPQSHRPVSQGFFEALGVTFSRGRSFTVYDGANDPPVAVVNQSFAELYWPGQEAVGKTLSHDEVTDAGSSEGVSVVRPLITVVGVVQDFGSTFYGEPPPAVIYLPLAQAPASILRLVVRTNGDPLPSVPAIREALAGVDAGVPVTGFRTGEGMVDEWLQESRAIGAALGLLAILALGMAMVGLYGMVAHSVAQRTFELGVRMVLGANRWKIRASVMRSFIKLAGIGMVIGVAIAGVFGVVARSFLVLLQVPYVPMVLGVTGLLMMVVVVAAYIPARRATAIQPVVALKCE